MSATVKACQLRFIDCRTPGGQCSTQCTWYNPPSFAGSLYVTVDGHCRSCRSPWVNVCAVFQVTNVATSIVALTKADHVPTNRVKNKVVKQAAKAAAARSLKAGPVGAGPLASAAAAGPLPSVAAAAVPAQPLPSAAGSTGANPDQAEATPSPAAVSAADRYYLAAHDRIQADYASFHHGCNT